MKRSDHQIVQDVLDGEVSKESFDAFQQRMRSEPQLAKFYGEYARLHHTLTEEYEGSEPSIHYSPQATGKSVLLVLWLAAAVVVLLGALAFFWKSSGKPSGPEALATVRFSPDAVWRMEGGGGKPTDLIAGSKLQLVQGLAEVSMPGGGRALVAGPSQFTLVSGRSAHLAAGRGKFSSGGSGKNLTITTPSMTAEDLGTEFGVMVSPDAPDEVHVFTGRVGMRVNGSSTSELLEAGEAGRIAGADRIERFVSAPERFPQTLHAFRTILSGNFPRPGWRVGHGNPSIYEDSVEGENFSAYLKLAETIPDPADPVMLVSFTMSQPTTGSFHTDGWAGMSFFHQGTERLFFGDSFGPERTWSLEVKPHVPLILPAHPVVGPRTVTLRYDAATGDVSLHEGRPPLSAAFCSGKLPPGSAFDEIRIGASSGAAFSVGALTIQTGGGVR
jgi:FecR protein